MGSNQSLYGVHHLQSDSARCKTEAKIRPSTHKLIYRGCMSHGLSSPKDSRQPGRYNHGSLDLFGARASDHSSPTWRQTLCTALKSDLRLGGNLDCIFLKNSPCYHRLLQHDEQQEKLTAVLMGMTFLALAWC